MWLAAAARAALSALQREPFRASVALELLQPPGVVPVPVRAAARLGEGLALGESCCDPGEGLDLTRGLVVWVLARWLRGDGPWLQLEPGEGVGVHAATGEACLSAYARELLEVNLRPLVPTSRRLGLTLVLPDGRRLAERTSNAAFGVVDGLALIGTQAEVQAGADPDQLARTLAALATRMAAPGAGGDLVLVIGENGLDLAPQLGLPPELLLKAGNWLGPVLVAAAEAGVERLLLFGYQGKLIKLAGGIFHTHHHLADGRAEVLTALAALEGAGGATLAALHGAATVEAALAGLEQADPDLAGRLRARIAAAIESRCRAYLASHGAPTAAVGAALFDRQRRLRVCGPVGAALMERFRGAT
ncbi:cobalamin biosynthesis protein CbiD [Cyanobium gracile PCC 6307]|uniref:Cobalt-precorrin-5B C(1)-methyltransferase n=1 Tax=Cyanobium gracile (strain ATCC 27147 / PCC 6307) TaxID=292564 RepID=K9P8Z6_CYAGP|nr:cobalamin biosynthesis protein CbiD [Cyanobium gracile PCC 6307]